MHKEENKTKANEYSSTEMTLVNIVQTVVKVVNVGPKFAVGGDYEQFMTRAVDEKKSL